jgi:hypothetical protein
LDRLDVLLLRAVGGLVILSRDRFLTSESADRLLRQQGWAGLPAAVQVLMGWAGFAATQHTVSVVLAMQRVFCSVSPK